MSFLEAASALDLGALRARLAACTAADVERALSVRRPELDECLALFSPAAASFLEPMARLAAARTRLRFGKVIQLYAPLYLSNECVNRCRYCGFARGLDVARRTLTLQEVRAEADRLAQLGFRHVLLLTGENPRLSRSGYLHEVVGLLAGRFPSLSVEVGPQPDGDYARLAAAGVDGFVLYQETYDRQLYTAVHPGGPKASYARRLEAIERAGAAGFRSLGIGALLGLGDWRTEAVLLAHHARFLGRRYWRSRIAVSFPRLRAHAGGELARQPVSDAALVQLICGMRLVLPDAELVLSTREPAALRDRLIPLGITRMSAGSRTSPGGYAQPDGAGAQFEIQDDRPAEEVAHAIAAAGFEPVWKDQDRALAVPWTA